MDVGISCGAGLAFRCLPDNGWAVHSLRADSGTGRGAGITVGGCLRDSREVRSASAVLEGLLAPGGPPRWRAALNCGVGSRFVGPAAAVVGVAGPAREVAGWPAPAGQADGWRCLADQWRCLA